MFCNGNCAFCSVPCRKEVKIVDDDIQDVDYVIKDEQLKEKKLTNALVKLIGAKK